MSDSYASHMERMKNDPRSIADLVCAALTEPDDSAWDAVSVLQLRGTHEVLQAALDLCHSECSEERGLGVCILAQLGGETRTFPQETIPFLIQMLEVEQDTEVLEEVLVALSHNKIPNVLSVVSRFVHHSEPGIRYGVVLVLSGAEDEGAIDQLIEFTKDSDSHVRDWATFGLGTLCELDFPQLRDALADRLDDSDIDTRGEALVGLARRGDRRVVAALLNELASDEVSSHAVEAAEIIRAPELYDALVELRDWWDDEFADLERAITACKPA